MAKQKTKNIKKPVDIEFNTLHYNALFEDNIRKLEDGGVCAPFNPMEGNLGKGASHKGLERYLRAMYQNPVYHHTKGFMYDIRSTPLYQDLLGKGWDNYIKTRKNVSREEALEAYERHKKHLE